MSDLVIFVGGPLDGQVRKLDINADMIAIPVIETEQRAIWLEENQPPPVHFNPVSGEMEFGPKRKIATVTYKRRYDFDKIKTDYWDYQPESVA